MALTDSNQDANTDGGDDARTLDAVEIKIYRGWDRLFVTYICVAFLGYAGAPLGLLFEWLDSAMPASWAKPLVTLGIAVLATGLAYRIYNRLHREGGFVFRKFEFSVPPSLGGFTVGYDDIRCLRFGKFTLHDGRVCHWERQSLPTYSNYSKAQVATMAIMRRLRPIVRQGRPGRKYVGTSERSFDSSVRAPQDGCEHCYNEVLSDGDRGGSVRGRANVNTATLDELVLLPGVTKAFAQRVIEFRDAHPFASTADVRKVKGLGEEKYNKMEWHLKVTGTSDIETFLFRSKRTTGVFALASDSCHGAGARLADFEQRAQAQPQAVREPEFLGRYIPMTLMADETERLAAQGKRSADCTQVKLLWASDHDVRHVTVEGHHHGANRGVGIYGTRAAKKDCVEYIVVMPDATVSSSVIELALETLAGRKVDESKMTDRLQEV